MLKIPIPVPGSREHGYVVRALEEGELVVVPTDTVYGIAAAALDESACARLNEVKGRPEGQPIAVIFASVAQLEESLPELSRRAWIAAYALLPGPVTLIVRNHDGLCPWLCGEGATTIGVRVPEVALDLPPLAATSANLAGEPEISHVAELPVEIEREVVVAVDAGVLPSGHASTILDLTVWEDTGDTADITVLRDPAGRGDALIQRLAGATS